MRTPLDDLIEELMPRAQVSAAWLGWAIACLLAIAVVVALSSIAHAQERPRVIFDCQQFAMYVRSLAMLREIGADRDKVISNLRSETRPGLMLAVLEREVKFVWTVKPTRAEAELSAFMRCQVQLGDMGAEG